MQGELAHPTAGSCQVCYVSSIDDRILHITSKQGMGSVRTCMCVSASKQLHMYRTCMGCCAQRHGPHLQIQLVKVACLHCMNVVQPVELTPPEAANQVQVQRFDAGLARRQGQQAGYERHMKYGHCRMLHLDHSCMAEHHNPGHMRGVKQG